MLLVARLAMAKAHPYYRLIRLAQPESPMERLMFVCPVTQRRVDVGVETEINTLLRIRTKTLRAKCPECGEWHEWTVGDAYLPEPTRGAAFKTL
jgi:hypothetical protein